MVGLRNLDTQRGNQRYEGKLADQQTEYNLPYTQSKSLSAGEVPYLRCLIVSYCES